MQETSIWRSFYINNCSVDINFIRNIANSFQSTCNNCVAGFQDGISPLVSFQRFFRITKSTWECLLFISFFFFFFFTTMGLVDVVLEVSENSHGNVYSEVIRALQARFLKLSLRQCFFKKFHNKCQTAILKIDKCILRLLLMRT